MQLQDKTKENIAYIAVFIAAASAVQAVEFLIPRPLPWLKLGLANMITLVAIISMGPRFALSVTVGRVILSSFLLGTFFSPTFYLSFSGAVVSCLVMIFLWRPFGWIGPIGISVTGAVFHNITQLGVVYLLLGKPGEILFLLPLLLGTAVFSGIVTGFVAVKVVSAIAEFSLRRIFLASSSDRRIEILRSYGLPFIAVPPKVEEENPSDNDDPEKFSLKQAENKLLDVEKKLSPPGKVIAADTVVEIHGKILVKPKNVEQARNMLSKLSGAVQKVYTAVVIKDLSTGRVKTGVETTELKMKKLTNREIEEFKDKNLDKAGGYAIQGMKDKYIDWIKGSYLNAVGFPVKTVKKLIK
ncbi:MAG: Gx transporter family protein [Elusimicrobiota bacterium]